MALTDMKEALLNNSYDYEPTDKTLTETWENSYSYLLALQQAYVKYEYFEAYSGNDPDDVTVLDWKATRDRKVIGHMYLDKYENVNFDIDYDIIHINKREAYRTSLYYQKRFTMDDIMFRSDIFRYMPIVFIDDKIQWDYTMKTTEEGLCFTTMFNRDFIIEQERTWNEEKQEYDDIIYKTHKIQVIIVESKYAWRFKSNYSSKAYPGNSSADNTASGPFRISSTNGEVRFRAKQTTKKFEEEHIHNTFVQRFDDFVASKRVSAYWQKPLNGLDAPAAINNTRFEAIDKRGGAYVKTTAVDGYPEFWVEKYVTNPDGTISGHMETISGSDMISMLETEAKKHITYPYFDVTNSNINGHHVLEKEAGTLFFAVQFPNEYGKEWWNNGTTLYPMDYDSTNGDYVGQLPTTEFNYMKNHPNQDFFMIFIFVNELHRQKLPLEVSGNITRTYTPTMVTRSVESSGTARAFKSFPFFEVGKEVKNSDNKNVYELFNMPIPTTNFIIKVYSPSSTILPVFLRSEDVLDLYYPNLYEFKESAMNMICDLYPNTYDMKVEVFYFYHEDIDHKYKDQFWFYRKYLYEAYKATYSASVTDYYEDMLLYAFTLKTSATYPTGALAAEYKTQFKQLYEKLYHEYHYFEYNYGETDYIHKWLPTHSGGNYTDYKIQRLKEWVTKDPETLHTYVKKQNKLGSSYGLYCSTINMAQRARTDTFREMADRDYEYVFIEPNSFGELTKAYEAVQNSSGTWVYKYINGQKVEVIPDTDVVYVDCGSATIPTKMYRWNGNALPGRTPQYVYFTTIRYFRDKNNNPETRFVFSMNNTRPYPILLDARIFVNGIMVVDVYQERKLFLDYFYIPAKYFTLNADNTCDDYIEIEVFPMFEITKKVRFSSANDEKTFMLFEPTSGNYYSQIDPIASQDYKSIPMYEKIDNNEDVYIRPSTPDYSMKDTSGNIYTMNKEATYNIKSEHQGEINHLTYNEVLNIRNTMYPEQKEVIIGYDDQGNPITEVQTIQVPDNVTVLEIEHTYMVTTSTGSFIKNITYQEFTDLRDNGELTPYNTASWTQLTQAFYHRNTQVDPAGNYSYNYTDPVFPDENTIYRELADEGNKWYFWDGFRYIYFDDSESFSNVFPTVMDAYFTDTYGDDPSTYTTQARFDVLNEATVTQIYENGEYNVVNRDTSKNPHEFTRLTKFKIKPKTVYSNLINRDVIFCIHKKSISYEVEINNEDGKVVTYVALEIRDKNFNYDKEYIRIYANGRLLNPTNWKLIYTFNCPRIYITTPVTYEDRIYIDITPYRYKHVFHKEEINPLNEIIDLKGYITKPFDTRYYDIYLNGRKLDRNNVYTIDPWSITLTNVKSKYDLDIYERDRDWEYYGLDYNTTHFTYSFDDLLATGMVPDSIKYKIAVDYIKEHQDERYKIVPNVNNEDRWFNELDYTQWAEIEIFYYDELLPKSYLNPDRVQSNNVIMEDDFKYVNDNFTIDPRQDTSDPDQRARRADHPKVIMLDPDLVLAHPASTPYPEDPDAPHTIVFTVGHPFVEVDQKYLNQDISDKLIFDSNI